MEGPAPQYHLRFLLKKDTGLSFLSAHVNCPCNATALQSSLGAFAAAWVYAEDRKASRPSLMLSLQPKVGTVHLSALILGFRSVWIIPDLQSDKVYLAISTNIYISIFVCVCFVVLFFVCFVGFVSFCIFLG